MRRGPGDAVLLFNGRDGEFSARIETLRRDRASLRVEQPYRGSRRRSPISGWHSHC